MSDSKFTYSLSGKILPERAVVNLPLVVKVLASPEGNMPAGWELVISIVRSQLAVTLTTNQLVNDLYDMRERVEGVVRFCVDTLGFLLACGYDVELTQVVALDTGNHKVFGVDVQGVREKDLYADPEILDAFQRILQVGTDKQQWLRRALVDFREAIRSYEDTPFFCFRAIEDLRQRFISGNDSDVKKTWRDMTIWLAVPQETVDYVWNELRPMAISLRHGAGTKVGRESRTHMLRVTWDLINRFISADLSKLNRE
jgi:hypothetical protein